MRKTTAGCILPSSINQKRRVGGSMTLLRYTSSTMSFFRGRCFTQKRTSLEILLCAHHKLRFDLYSQKECNAFIFRMEIVQGDV